MSAYETDEKTGITRRRITCNTCFFGDAPTYHGKILCRIDMPHESKMMEESDVCDRYRPAPDGRY